ncbi:MAG: aminotransferase class I/II-fold pyridoxal phosphate-dependent enzyme [Alphaproteobacteria bacterium]|nr:aminotransferase class I/II-fold pyridoxal phosphate-dependent enzyme [Alphaproteobacteria bacterium]
MTQLPTFKLEKFLNQWEFKSRYLLCCSDGESMTMQDLLSMADEGDQHLWKTLDFKYTEPKGHPKVLEAIAQHYNGQGGLTFDASQIVTFAGAEEAIFCTLMTLINPGDHVITLSPNYESLEKLPRHFGADVSVLELQEADHWRLDLRALEKMITPKTTMIILNYPHNPTGSHLSFKEMQTIVEVARAHNLYLFNDEVYRFMEIDPLDRIPPVACLYEKGISVSVMTKAYGLAGLRVGWVAHQNNKLLSSILNTKFYTSICNSAPSEILALIALKNSSKIIEKAQILRQKNLRLLDAFLMRHKDHLSWVRPKAGCIGLIRIKDTTINAEALSTQALDQEGVLIMPASLMGGRSEHFRVGFGRENFEESLHHFEKVINRCFA